MMDIEVLYKKYEPMVRGDTPGESEALTKREVEIARFILAEALKPGMGSTRLMDLKRECGFLKKNSCLLRVARGTVGKEMGLGSEDIRTLEEKFRIKRGKSHSGILSVTVFTSPYPEYTDAVSGERKRQEFSCKWDCHYCPKEPGQPRSYLLGEPGVLRANRYGFDCCAQMWARLTTLVDIGHPIDKLEVLVLGGTWESYPLEYRREFARDIYYSANVFWESSGAGGSEERREKRGLEFERRANRDSVVKVIGLTIETRPDTVCEDALRELRMLGCTRVQLGIQHIDDGVLEKINRKCSTGRAVEAIRLLKDWGFKIDGHFMPNLPGASPELDRWMFGELLGVRGGQRLEHLECNERGIHEWRVYELAREDLQVDQWKVYPCATVPFTTIEKWYTAGEYSPYGEPDLREVLLDMKQAVFPWIRLNRIIRDIPSDYIICSGDHTNMRQDLMTELKRRGGRCACIRCREVKAERVDLAEARYLVREYGGSGGREYFISAESGEVGRDALCGFVRLRVCKTGAWVRELHVYGQLQVAKGGGSDAHAPQHKGIGRTLMGLAEAIAKERGEMVLRVISGEGTKRYYEKLGYTEDDLGYMVKMLM